MGFDAVETVAIRVKVVPVEVFVVHVGHNRDELHAVKAGTGRTGFKVQARCTFKSADDVADTQREPANGCVETRSAPQRHLRVVLACGRPLGTADTGAVAEVAVSFRTNTCTQRYATIGFGRHVELQTQTRNDEGGRLTNNRILVRIATGRANSVASAGVAQTKTAIAAD